MTQCVFQPLDQKQNIKARLFLMQTLEERAYLTRVQPRAGILVDYSTRTNTSHSNVCEVVFHNDVLMLCDKCHKMVAASSFQATHYTVDHVGPLCEPNQVFF